MTKNKKLIWEIVVVVLMIALLTGVLVYYNAIDKIPTSDLNQDNAGDNDDTDFIPYGYDPGFKCPTYDLQNVYDSGKTNIADLRGKVVIINFWYTTCQPCIAELPHFNELATNYQEDVVIIIVHAAFDQETTAPWLNEHFPGTKMKAVFDEKVQGEGDYYYTKLGGGLGYPRTLILDKKGIVTHSQNGGITYTLLESKVQEALNK